ncbi:(2Fe-2S)-binding protein [Novisyntrophococcus fermenticellae]|uniref:(2Fe-2S)-binding protein n=1 Tax=Novisyntrophococcus fermenticellae TaxID=2068655 RepID=UPI001E54EEE6|nr:2Fe-2S iron-sulfur cluster-binding protein [Novisyntrophococcus fermenticellae]
MLIQMWLNGETVRDHVNPDTLLLDFVRKHGCASVKRGCETANCGLCTVMIEGKPILSCSTLAARAAGKHVVTLEGIQAEAKEFGEFLADQGADQCGYCNPGFIMNILAMMEELDHPDDEEVKEYLAGNLCRCSGFVGQMRSIQAYMRYKKGEA